MSKQWYVLHTYVGQERKVEKALRFLMQEENFKLTLLDVSSPSENVVEMKQGKRRKGTRNFFPGYVLVQMDLPDDGWERVLARVVYTQGVTGFIRSNKANKPIPLSSEEVRSILTLTGDIHGKVVSVRMSFTEKEVVRVIDGPFKTFTGTIETINKEKEKLRVMVGIFGRSTPVEVGFNQVEKV